jgi:hypothetical protein
MSVAATQRTGQYAERPGGNRGELNWNQSAPEGALKRVRDCPLLAPGSGRSKRGVS